MVLFEQSLKISSRLNIKKNEKKNLSYFCPSFTLKIVMKNYKKWKKKFFLSYFCQHPPFKSRVMALFYI